MRTKDSAVTAVLVAGVFIAQLPALCQVSSAQPLPNHRRTKDEAISAPRPSYPDDLLIVQLSDGADRTKFDDLLQEVHGQVIQTVEAGPQLKFLFVKAEPGQADAVQKRLSKTKEVSLVERNQIFHTQGSPFSSEAAALGAQVSALAKKKSSAQSFHKKKPKKTTPQPLSIAPNDLLFADQYAAATMNWTKMRTEDTAYQKPVVYCNLDTGGTPIPNELLTDAVQFDYSDPASPTWGKREAIHDTAGPDNIYHGTGTVAVTAGTDDRIGLAGLANPTGRAIKVYIFRVSQDGYSVSLAGIVGALSHILNNREFGSVVINVSANGSFPFYFGALQSIVSLARRLHDDKQSIIYNAAGNDGGIDFAPSVPGLVRVSAIDQTGAIPIWATYTEAYPRFAAPGVHVAIYNPTVDVDTPDYGDGSSYASPNFAGACACLVHRGVTATKAHEILMRTATIVPSDLGNFLVPNLGAAMKVATGH
jgi:hypothetical protein